MRHIPGIFGQVDNDALIIEHYFYGGNSSETLFILICQPDEKEPMDRADDCTCREQCHPHHQNGLP
jgi:hypothetical protein